MAKNREPGTDHLVRTAAVACDVMAAILRLTPDEAFAIAVKAGIYTKSGKLRKAYR